MKYIKPLSILSILLACISSCTSIEQSASPVPPVVEDYITQNGNDFNEYQLSDCSRTDYNEVKQYYHIDEPLDEVWAAYLNTDTKFAFTNGIMSFGVMYNPEDSVLYNSASTEIPAICEDQIFILELTYLGFYRIPAAFKVSSIDPDNKRIEFIYLKENKSNGYQQMIFTDAADSAGRPGTDIEHISYFRSDDGLRDRLLYPPFHKRTIDDFHINEFNLNSFNWNRKTF